MVFIRLYGLIGFAHLFFYIRSAIRIAIQLMYQKDEASALKKVKQRFFFI